MSCVIIGSMKLNINSFDINSAGIYRILNAVTGKFYIGSSNRCSKRYAEHLWALTNNKHDNEKLQNSFNKHGVDAFEFQILEPILDISKLQDIEQVYLDWFKVAETGYNISGLANRVEMNEATRAKISETHKTIDRSFQRQRIKEYKEANPEKASETLERAWRNSSDRSRLVSEETLIQIIKDYLTMEVPSIIVLAKKYSMCYSTLAKIFKRTSDNSKYKEFLIKIGFEGNSIKDLRKPEIQAKLHLTQD